MNAYDLAASAEAVRAAAENLARRRRADVQLKTTEALLARRRKELADRERDLEVEQEDVRKLEHLSLTKIWSTLRGNTADRVAVERAEAEAALLAVASAHARLDSAVADDARVRREHRSLRGAEREYSEALAAHERVLRAAGGPDAAELTELAAQLGAAEALQREVTEAIRALGNAGAALDVALEKLNDAGGWATYDTFFGGGLIGDIAKHSKINEATESFVEVNRALERLSVELADIGVSSLDGVEISDTLAVFDVMFDNILSDWMVKSRIYDARANARALRGRLEQLADELDTRARTLSTQLTALRARREEILTSA